MYYIWLSTRFSSVLNNRKLPPARKGVQTRGLENQQLLFNIEQLLTKHSSLKSNNKKQFTKNIYNMIKRKIL